MQGGAAGTLTYFAAPIAGAKTVMLEEFTPEGALELIEKEKATAIGVVPTHLVRMLEADYKKYDLSSLRFIRSAGGYLSPQVAEEAEEAFGASITSDLGTQDKGSVSGCSVEDSKELRRRTVGRMLPGNKVRLVDEEGNVVPDGEPGILYFRGPHAPAGYYRDEELTATVFDEDGWCTTEDIVKFDEGCLWILGRAKDMIIRGGQNIYPAEVEGLLNEHPKVSSVAIVGYPDRAMGEKCCAYVIPKPGETFTFEEMVSFLKEKQLAMFKLPERLEVVAEFPAVGDSGKVNKETLKKMIKKLKQTRGVRRQSAKRSALKLCESWQNRFGQEKTMQKAVLIISTLDTKGEETLYLRDKVASLGMKPLLMDISMRGKGPSPAEITPAMVAEAGGSTLEEIHASRERAKITNITIKGASNIAKDLFSKGELGGVLGHGRLHRIPDGHGSHEGAALRRPQNHDILHGSPAGALHPLYRNGRHQSLSFRD